MKERSNSLKNILAHFTLIKHEFSSYDSYYACKMLLTEFYDKKSTGDYLQFVFDVASEHIEAKDWNVLKEFIASYISKYRALDRRIEDVSINQ